MKKLVDVLLLFFVCLPIIIISLYVMSLIESNTLVILIIFYSAVWIGLLINLRMGKNRIKDSNYWFLVMYVLNIFSSYIYLKRVILKRHFIENTFIIKLVQASYKNYFVISIVMITGGLLVNIIGHFSFRSVSVLFFCLGLFLFIFLACLVVEHRLNIPGKLKASLHEPDYSSIFDLRGWDLKYYKKYFLKYPEYLFSSKKTS